MPDRKAIEGVLGLSPDRLTAKLLAWAAAIRRDVLPTIVSVYQELHSQSVAGVDMKAQEEAATEASPTPPAVERKNQPRDSPPRDEPDKAALAPLARQPASYSDDTESFASSSIAWSSSLISPVESRDAAESATEQPPHTWPRAAQRLFGRLAEALLQKPDSLPWLAPVKREVFTIPAGAAATEFRARFGEDASRENYRLSGPAAAYSGESPLYSGPEEVLRAFGAAINATETKEFPSLRQAAFLVLVEHTCSVRRNIEDTLEELEKYLFWARVHYFPDSDSVLDLLRAPVLLILSLFSARRADSSSFILHCLVARRLRFPHVFLALVAGKLGLMMTTSPLLAGVEKDLDQLLPRIFAEVEQEMEQDDDVDQQAVDARVKAACDALRLKHDAEEARLWAEIRRLEAELDEWKRKAETLEAQLGDRNPSLRH